MPHQVDLSTNITLIFKNSVLQVILHKRVKMIVFVTRKKYWNCKYTWNRFNNGIVGK